MQEEPFTRGKSSATPLRAEILIDASVAEVWDVVGENFDQIVRYSSEVANSYFLHQVDGMAGSQRRSEMHNGRTLDVEITDWEDKTRVQWEIVKPHIPVLKSGVSSFTLIPHGSQTRLVLDGSIVGEAAVEVGETGDRSSRSTGVLDAGMGRRNVLAR